MRHGSRPILALTLGLPLLGAGPPPLTEVSVVVTGLRNTKGQVLACLTAQPKGFPDCRKDPAAKQAIVPAAATVRINFGPVPAGRYAISLIHDENANRKMDMALIMPKEGYGFSRDAPVTMGPPKFDKAAFDVAGTAVEQTARIRYLL
ncbi:MAG: hypothetical protein RL671_794 [Pseudomonadota bacterium]|uniref:DUF2141 domain-containing protein n=1 Tax=Novosphingobium sp. APW14 TaxID=3077237 RepID=UPI0028DFB55B|nr:DUF2141 domain-containing protein [Novosphingobium sp. APW14]MDT9013510.1 DUF2141 domain-containing protein [Novosphingobium sp. APW14]